MNFSNDITNAFLDAIRGQGFTLPSYNSFFVGLLREDDSEVDGAGYIRQELEASLLTWSSTQGTVGEASTGTTNTITLEVAITYPMALEDWGSVNRLRFYYASSGDSYLFDTDFSPIFISNGSTFSVPTIELTMGTPSTEAPVF